MKKTISMLFMALLAVALMPSAKGEAVDEATAERVARNFWNAHRERGVAELTAPMTAVKLRWDAFYLFRTDEAKGFVIVAADDCVEPVLAYSFHNNAMRDTVGRETAWWLDGWQREMDYCRANGLKATPATALRWAALKDGNDDPQPLTVVEPMLTTTWDQDEPYSDLCPGFSFFSFTMHTATGCVATAMAQIMRYWRYPEHGYGSHSYYSYSIMGWGAGYGVQSADFGATTYDWDNMPDVLTSVSSEAEKEAVSTLMYHCGVACDMIYGTALEGGSGSYIHNIPVVGGGNSLNGMAEYFGYSAHTRGVERLKYDDDTWTAMVRGEIDAGRPVLYAGGDETSGGHCFVCDGYDSEGRYHFNWGWSGEGDGYYQLSHLAPGTGGTGGGTGTYDFSNGQQMLVGLQPHSDANDFGMAIHHYPYVQNFDEAAIGWKATPMGDNSYSWMIVDSVGCRGNYSAFAVAPISGTSKDTLYSPYITHPGTYEIKWEDKVKTSSVAETYKVLAGETELFSSTIDNDDWMQHEVEVTVAEGDSVRLLFVYFGSLQVKGMFMDEVTITRRGGSVAVDDVEESAVRVYPNPAKDCIRIDGAKSVRELSIYDATGRQVLQQELPQPTVDMTGLQAGIYLLRLTTDVGVSTHKIIKY